MGGGIETLPPYILQDILYNGQLGPVDLASLEASSYMFRAASGIEPYRFKSITELAAHHSCKTHPLFEKFPPRARSELLARCEGNWKLVFHFLESLQHSSGRGGGGAGNNVLAAAGKYHTLLVNEKGELYACGKVLGQDSVLNLQTPTLISLPATVRRIVQISASHNHAAFITDIGKVYAFGDNTSGCCGVGERGVSVTKPTLVIALIGSPCQQVATGQGFTLAITRAGEVFSWGCNSHGQLGHGTTQEELRPRQIEQFDESNPVAQVSAGVSHTLAVTKSGQLYSWGYGSNYCLGHDDFLSQLQPKRIEHGGFDDLFITSVVAGDEHSAAIDSSGYVYTWGKGYCGALGHGAETDQTSPLRVDGLKSCRAVQVVARRRKTFVLSDNGTVHSFGWVAFYSLGVQGKAASDKVLTPQSLDLALEGHKISSISAGQYHTLVLTKKGAIFGFGDNDKSQLGMCPPLRAPEEVFTSLTGVTSARLS
ncbi:hypothetical protein KC19_9G125100 [Ceratodon purpureus]|uniref:RCC1-like domain-containing protein n=1 Tax=Ceratodon purpureus TaxID=3225 RepID=A0A8T0GUF0_CERPU|nr:hypothetical protein KC19_9G125100 [Ceratodon purpureus]